MEVDAVDRVLLLDIRQVLVKPKLLTCELQINGIPFIQKIQLVLSSLQVEEKSVFEHKHLRNCER